MHRHCWLFPRPGHGAAEELMIAMGPSSKMHKCTHVRTCTHTHKHTHTHISTHTHRISPNVMTTNDSIGFLHQQLRKLHGQFGGSSTTLHYQCPSAGKQRQRDSLVKTVVSAFTWVEIYCRSIHKGTQGSACAKGWCLDSTGPRNHMY